MSSLEQEQLEMWNSLVETTGQEYEGGRVGTSEGSPLETTK